MKSRLMHIWSVVILLAALLISVAIMPGSAVAAIGSQHWYRLRANSVPYQPGNVAADSEGGLWVTSISGYEYAPGVWYLPPGAANGRFHYITDNWRNNRVTSQWLTLIAKLQLSRDVLYAIRDNSGNVWYSLDNRQVFCEKPDGSWLEFAMQNTSSGGVDSVTVDSAHRIRLIDRPGGGQEVLLISARGVIRIGPGLTMVENRVVWSPYNNDFINDVLIDAQGRYWVASNRGVEQGTSLGNTTYVPYLYPNNPSVPGIDSDMPITCLAEDANGGLWFGSNAYVADGIYCFTATGQWLKYADGVAADIGKKIVSIAAAPDGSVWFGALLSQAGGILRFIPGGGGQWIRYRKEQLGTQSEAVISLSWANGGLWFVTGYEPSVPGNGTGVHFLALDQQGQPQTTHYTFREDSSTLTSNRFHAIAADKSGGVWFPAYNDPSIAHLKADGTWEQFRGAVGGSSLGEFGMRGVAADSTNKVYFAPLHQPPVAYNAAAGEWINLASLPAILTSGSVFYYGIYTDQEDGKWFYGAFGACYLNPDNTSWVWYDSANTAQFPDTRVDGVLRDDHGNVWFMTWYGLALMKKDPPGGEPVWKKFISGDASGYLSGYRVYVDDNGDVWNSAKQKFDPATDAWVSAADTSPLDRRRLRFLNGWIPADMDLSHALPPVVALDQQLMTVDARGAIYFCGGLGNVNAGIVAAAPPSGDANGSFSFDLADLITVLKIGAGVTPYTVSLAGDLNQDGGIGLADAIMMLQILAQIRPAH